jgi:hypothetical protein
MTNADCNTQVIKCLNNMVFENNHLRVQRNPRATEDFRIERNNINQELIDLVANFRSNSDDSIYDLKYKLEESNILNNNLKVKVKTLESKLNDSDTLINDLKSKSEESNILNNNLKLKVKTLKSKLKKLELTKLKLINVNDKLEKQQSCSHEFCNECLHNYNDVFGLPEKCCCACGSYLNKY